MDGRRRPEATARTSRGSPRSKRLVASENGHDSVSPNRSTSTRWMTRQKRSELLQRQDWLPGAPENCRLPAASSSGRKHSYSGRNSGQAETDH